MPLLLVWTLDRITKYCFLDFPEDKVKFFGPLGFTLHHNSGAILGFFSDLPPLLRIVSLSTSGGFLIFIFIIIQIFLPIRSPFLRSGMAILLGGILGNIADRIYWGSVIDFVFVSVFSYYSPVFNLADALQWVGYILIVYGFVIEGKELWPESNLRQSYIIDKKYQIRYCMRLISFGLAFAIIAGIYSYTFLRVALQQIASDTLLSGATPIDANRILITFLILYIIISIVFTVILFFSGIAISHRVAGPVYAFQKFLEDIMDGNLRSLKLRMSDEFIQLEGTANKFVKKFSHLFEREVCSSKKDDPAKDDSNEDDSAKQDSS